MSEKQTALEAIEEMHPKSVKDFRELLLGAMTESIKRCKKEEKESKWGKGATYIKIKMPRIPLVLRELPPYAN